MKLRTRAVSLTSLAAIVLASGGCAALSDDSAGDDDTLTVAAAFYPLVWTVEQIAGEHAEVVSLTRPGQDAHDGELSLSSTATLTKADVVVVSEGFQPAVAASVAANATGSVIEVSDVVTLREIGGSDHSEGATSDHQGHDHGELDPHFWLDPIRVADLGDAVARELGAADPEHSDDFAEAATSLRQELTTLDSEYTEGLAACARSTVVVSHDAFGYLRKYGLEFEPIAGLSPGAEPTPADIARLQRLIADQGITTVFNETLAPVEIAESIAKDLKVGTAVLDPLEGVTADSPGDDYLSVMRSNLAALEKANQC